MTEVQRGLLSGLIMRLTALPTGQRTNPMTTTMKIVFTPWEWDVALCGMMWDVMLATIILVQKVFENLLL